MAMSVSVALATYNGVRFVGAQVASILEQTHPPAEVIVSDDGSADGTLDRIRDEFDRRPKHSTRLILLGDGGHLGVTGNFERALEACSGDLIALADQDDLWRPDRLEIAKALFEADDSALFTHSDARLIGPNGDSLGLSLFEALPFNARDRAEVAAGRAFDVYLRRNLATGATVLLRRRLLDSVLPIPVGWVHDEWLAIVAAALGGVRVIEEPLIDYRQHGGNAIGVAEPTLAYRVARMLAPRGDRYRVLAERAEELVARLEELLVSESVLTLARSKARFEIVRKGLPEQRLARIPAVLREYRAGSYATLSSQGDLDVIRDILQPS